MESEVRRGHGNEDDHCGDAGPLFICSVAQSSRAELIPICFPKSVQIYHSILLDYLFIVRACVCVHSLLAYRIARACTLPCCSRHFRSVPSEKGHPLCAVAGFCQPSHRWEIRVELFSDSVPSTNREVLSSRVEVSERFVKVYELRFAQTSKPKAKAFYKRDISI